MADLRPYTGELFAEMHKPTAKLIGASFAPMLVLPPSQRPSWAVSPYAMSMAMMGEYELPPVDEQITKRGKFLEPVTIAKLRDEGHEAESLFHYVVHPKNDHFIASPDYAIDDIPWGEGKAPTKWEDWSEDIPLYPQLQSQWTMFCGETDRHMVSGLLVDRAGIEIKTKIVERHDKLIKLMEERADDMLDRVERGQACDPDESDSTYRALQEMIELGETEVIELNTEEAANRLSAWRQANLDKKAAEAAEKAAKNWMAVRAGTAAIVQVFDDSIRRKRVAPEGKAAHWRWSV